MKTTSITAFLTLLAITSVNAQGPLTPPPGAPAPVMKSLDQIEARTPLIEGAPGVTFTNGHYTITQPGSYYLTGNLTCTDTSGYDFITLATNEVTLDLNGFTIFGTTGNMGNAIHATGSGYRIRNGRIVGGTTQSNGTFTKAGFNTGIHLFSGSALVGSASIVTDVIVRGVREHGIFTSFECVVDRCVTDTTGSHGINAGIVRASRAVNAGGDGINGSNISDCCGKSVGSGDGISYYFQSESSAVANSVGVAVSGVGIRCTNANNCTGTSGSGYGLIASGTASFCRGKRDGGVALQTAIAIGCTSAGGTISAPQKHLGTP